MSLEPLPPKLEKGIEQFAAEQHISTDEAIRTLLTSALDQAALSGQHPNLGTGHKSTPIAPNLEIARKKSIIGMFPNDPEFDKTMDAVIASRAERYAADR
jgi:hypothetical protein